MTLTGAVACVDVQYFSNVNSISEFLVSHMVGVYFVYGLAFFVLGTALLLANRRVSTFRFATVLLPFALFGLLHGLHEWFEMFQLIGAGHVTQAPPLWQDVLRVGLLATSFTMLLVFALLLLGPETGRNKRTVAMVAALFALCLVGTVLAARRYAANIHEFMLVTDVFVRYTLGIPAALLAAWALMAQQRIFRDSDMPEFGASLVWCASALIVYGLVGQLFVGSTILPVNVILNSENFLAWFGIPVQLFRAMMAIVLTVFMLRVLGVFEAEETRRLRASNEAKLAAQQEMLDAVRTSNEKMETVNRELKLAMQRLSLLVDLSNTLQGKGDWPEPLVSALKRIVNSLTFANAGLVLLTEREDGPVRIAAECGYGSGDNSSGPQAQHREAAVALGQKCLSDGYLRCLHADGNTLSITLEDALQQQACRGTMSPTLHAALPLHAGNRTIGSLVFTNKPVEPNPLLASDLSLMVGIARELGLSVENALLQTQALEREQILAELLEQVVNAQEAERQRIARELHDATGQSLTAIGLGLRGIQAQLQQILGADEVSEVRQNMDNVLSYSNSAMSELRDIIADLRPPQLDELGLEATIQWYGRTYEQRWGIPISFTSSGNCENLPSDYSTVLFRILQEALRNVAKHADASQALVDLVCTDQDVILSIQDDGQGFDVPAEDKDLGSDGERIGWGLAGMRERVSLVGGELHVKSSPGEGTRVVVKIPLTVPSTITR